MGGRFLNGAGSPDENLIDGYYESNNYGVAPAEINVTGPDEFAIHDIYVYLTQDEGGGSLRSGLVELNGGGTNDITVKSGLDGFGGYDLADDDDGINVFKFAGLTGNDSQILVGGPDVPNRLRPAGIQIVEIPEPATLVLIASGLLGLLVYGWRRKRA